jgi:ArsR family transcriptional regulator, arsenate/arsenite/antimonite-responsive transcriptional repressor
MVAPDRARTTERAALLAVVADPVRWRILAGLGDGPRCVCAIQTDVEVSASLLSYHLKVLREAGLISASRHGRWIDYTVAPDAHDRIVAALPTAER